MKPITLHPASVLAGLALAGVLAAASQSVTRVQPFPKETVRLVGEVPAEWWTYMRVGDGVPLTYTVPSDRYLVVTETLINGTVVLANGVSCVSQLQPASHGTESHGTRVVFQPGTVLTCPNAAELWGYLEPVQ